MEECASKIDVAAACGRAMKMLAEGSLAPEAIAAGTGLSAGAVGVVRGAVSRDGAAAEGGWKSLPDKARFSIIKSEYYPTPTKGTWILARLLAEGAEDTGSAAAMAEDHTMRSMVRAGHVRRAGAGRFHLAGMGRMLAREVLDAYPEIGRPAFSKEGGAEGAARRMVGECAALRAPPQGRGRGGTGRRARAQ